MEYKTRTTQEKTAAVLTLLNNFKDCWNAKDLEHFGDFFTEEAEYTDVTGQSALGREAIVKQHEYPFRTVNKTAIFQLDNLLIRDLSPNLCIISGGWTVTGSQTPNGQPLPDRNGIIHLIAEENEGKWLFKLVYNADVQTVFFRDERDLKSGKPQ